MKKWGLSLILMLWPFCAFSGETSGYCGPKDSSGNWGTNCTWEYDTQTHTLTVSGTGTLAGGLGKQTNENGETIYFNAAPWAEYAQDIKNAVINEGIETISGYTFYETTLEHVSIPQSVTVINGQSFQDSRLKEVNLPQNLTSIGHAAFSATYIESFVIPASFRGSATHIFASLNLKSITIEGNADFTKAMLGGKITKLTDIYCDTSNENCHNLLSDEQIGSKIKFYEKFGDQYLFKGKFYTSLDDIAGRKYDRKRIYTIDEANAVAGKVNSVKIRYR